MNHKTPLRFQRQCALIPSGSAFIEKNFYTHDNKPAWHSGFFILNMGLEYKLLKAEKIIENADPESLKSLKEICRDIQNAEKVLSIKAEELLNECGETCQGLCCRNIHIDDIVTFLDFVYILTLKNSLKNSIHTRLKKEPFFSSNCIFLQNGKGPCIFPPELRPEKCLITFCCDDTPIKKELNNVRTNFNRLSRFLLLNKFVFLKNILKKSKQR